MAVTANPLKMDVETFHELTGQLRREIGQVIVGQEEIVEELLVAFFGGGHVLLEGVPGLGKTLLAKTFAQTLGFEYKRVQFTPDLMPADIIGTQVVVERDGKKEFEFSAGPVFTHILLADEINRTTPKTQSALLEAMEEKQVSVAGKTYVLKEPFFVMATENPIEMEGVYNLPEAQLDRFFVKLHIPYPKSEELLRIVQQTTGAETAKVQTVLPKERGAEVVGAMRHLVREVLVAKPVQEYAVRLVMATHPNGKALDGYHRYIGYGASPRAAQALLLGAKVHALLSGRVNVSFEDVEKLVFPALNHRIVLSFEAEADRVGPRQILDSILKEVPRNA